MKKKLMLVVIYTAIIVSISIVSFLAGMYFKKQTIANADMFILKEPLTINVMDGENKVGIIPANAVIYKYRDLPEISTYFMFLNIKGNDKLTPFAREKFNLLVPVDAY